MHSRLSGQRFQYFSPGLVLLTTAQSFKANLAGLFAASLRDDREINMYMPSDDPGK